MTDSIDRIMPATAAPVAATRRERDPNGRGGGQERELERQERGGAPAQRAEEGAPKDQLKGNRLNISV